MPLTRGDSPEDVLPLFPELKRGSAWRDGQATGPEESGPSRIFGSVCRDQARKRQGKADMQSETREPKRGYREGHSLSRP